MRSTGEQELIEKLRGVPPGKYLTAIAGAVDREPKANNMPCPACSERCERRMGNRWHCLTCKRHGDIIDAWGVAHGEGPLRHERFRQALGELARLVGPRELNKERSRRAFERSAERKRAERKKTRRREAEQRVRDEETRKFLSLLDLGP